MIDMYRDADGRLLAIVLSHETGKTGIEFITPPENALQVAYMHHLRGHEIALHEHLPQERTLHTTQEVLLVRSGTIEATLHNGVKFTLLPGDVVVLVAGGHSFKMLTDCELYEVKQGPYIAANDKRWL